MHDEDWYEQYEAAKQALENAVAGFFLTHPEYLPPGQRSASRYTLQLLDFGHLKALEDAMQEASRQPQQTNHHEQGNHTVSAN